jgi:uncharacterized protein YecE (DUF72 family)
LQRRDFAIACDIMPGQDQLDLFGGPPTPAKHRAVTGRAPIAPHPHPSELAELAARMPATLRMGTSSWAYTGWADLVYAREYPQQRLSREGLAAYAAHPLFKAVGVDRSYYAPPSADEFAAYAAAVPPDFRFLVKAHEACTIAVYPRHARYGALRGQPNPRFLDVTYASEEVVAPTVAGLGERLGPILFQFSPTDVDALGGSRWFAERVHRFLCGLPRGPLYAVEIRNRELLTGTYADALADCGACHCINVYPGMPSARQQFERTRQDQARAVVCRWMLHPGMTYETAEAAYEPFNRLVAPDPDNREELAQVCLRAGALGLDTHVIVNNKAEGSSPCTIAALAARIAESSSQP